MHCKRLPATALVLGLAGLFAAEGQGQGLPLGQALSPAPATGLSVPMPSSTMPPAPMYSTPTNLSQLIGFRPTIRPADLSGLVIPVAVEEKAAPARPAAAAHPAQRLTIEEARQRVLANNKLLQLAAMNIQGKEFATEAVRADYFPKLIGSVSYFNFDQPLGNVVSFSGRTLSSVGRQVTTPGLQIQGPGGRTLVNLSP